MEEEFVSGFKAGLFVIMAIAVGYTVLVVRGIYSQLTWVRDYMITEFLRVDGNIKNIECTVPAAKPKSKRKEVENSNHQWFKNNYRSTMGLF